MIATLIIGIILVGLSHTYIDCVSRFRWLVVPALIGYGCLGYVIYKLL